MNENKKIHRELLNDMDAKVSEKEPCHFGNVVLSLTPHNGILDDMIEKYRKRLYGADYIPIDIKEALVSGYKDGLYQMQRLMLDKI